MVKIMPPLPEKEPILMITILSKKRSGKSEIGILIVM
jgi:hypothetical protein